MSDKKLLKRCPFCGGEALLKVVPPHKHKIAIFPDYEGGAFIECTKCTCAISGDTEEEAVNAWNARKPMEKIVERLEDKHTELQDGRINLANKSLIDESTRRLTQLLLEKQLTMREAIDVVKEEGGLNA